MNWGKKIILVYVVFVIGIMFLVFKSSSQKIDLVTTDYYAKELKYQDKIDEQKRVAALSDTINYQITNDKFIIKFPKDFSGKTIAGDVVLYCPSNEDNDVKQKFTILDSNVEIPLLKIQKGHYNLQLSWKADAISYYYETNIDIKK